MILPTAREVRTWAAQFIREESISWRTFFHPVHLFDILLRHRFVQFVVVGGTSAMISLVGTWFFATFVFGIDQYFSGYLISTGAALLFNFALYSLQIFRTGDRHVERLLVYLAYMFVVIVVQASVVRHLTALLGVSWYMPTIASVIAVFATVNFLVFKFSVFGKR